MSVSEQAEPVEQAGSDSDHHRARLRRPDVPRGAVPASDGILLVDKPQGLTSHDVVGATRRLAATRKVGHAGTLDPMATGLLLLGVGRATRFLTYLVGADKTYAATIRLGLETTTEDAEGEVTAAHGCRIDDLSGDRLQKALAGLTGQIQQVPSAVSAIKVDGVRAYKRVRDGQDVELEARPVTIHELRLTGEPRQAVVDLAGAVAGGVATGAETDGAGGEVQVVDLDVVVSCSSGTYVRALARDLGQALGCGAHLTALRRTGVGPFDVGQASTLIELSEQVETDAVTPDPRGAATVPLEEVARRCFERLALTEPEARGLRHGQPLDAAVLERAEAPEGWLGEVASKGISRQRVVAGFAPDGRLVALLRHQGSRARPVLVLDPA
ncbi:tRNA pseudouridine(55) synthase TruB [Actinomyces naeslundii]|uniref:tRNA pseudouridine(55) synthase TruB n=1 Tax=Actinomyces naeslundii TaxID=1655 RepID=UPI000C75F64C|nr:tRNA pseudouridine(55) synthase TruB [Actinomyces naeslundii]PKY95183.1 tRNA pseudouridine(55) synthase TruB [Actinomyces naeslundii]